MRFPPTEPIPTGIEDGRHGAQLAGLSTGAMTSAEQSGVGPNRAELELGSF